MIGPLWCCPAKHTEGNWLSSSLLTVRHEPNAAPLVVLARSCRLAADAHGGRTLTVLDPQVTSGWRTWGIPREVWRKWLPKQ